MFIFRTLEALKTITRYYLTNLLIDVACSTLSDIKVFIIFFFLFIYLICFSASLNAKMVIMLSDQNNFIISKFVYDCFNVIQRAVCWRNKKLNIISLEDGKKKTAGLWYVGDINSDYFLVMLKFPFLSSPRGTYKHYYSGKMTKPRESWIEIRGVRKVWLTFSHTHTYIFTLKMSPTSLDWRITA